MAFDPTPGVRLFFWRLLLLVFLVLTLYLVYQWGYHDAMRMQ